ncbi:hypothetical protein TNCV_4507281 [Trichonephila clavipes]|nr:hypothetical protein TNCV_4507281 [Trichonephila clavipes]
MGGGVSYATDMDAVDFLQHETSPTWVGVEPATLGYKPTTPPSCQAESLPEPYEIGNLIKDVVELARQIKSEVDSVESSRTAEFPQSGAENG